MIILLDIDGVLVTTPSWKAVEHLSDGFLKFDENSTRNLGELFEQTKASIVLTTTHRVNYNEEQWIRIFKTRGLNFENISKVNNKTSHEKLEDRGTEIAEWIEHFGLDQNYVILDDDLSINALPQPIKDRWVSTKPMIGFNEEPKQRALKILGL